MTNFAAAGRVRWTTIMMVAAALIASLVGSATQADAAELTEPLPVAQQVIGEATGGLVEGEACGSLLALQDSAGSVLGCTHGHDDVPAAEAPAAGAFGTAPSAPCFGDGRDGMRVQAVYAHAAGTADRYAATSGRLREMMDLMTHGLQQSASAAGGGRHVRYVTDGRCQIVIDRITVPADAAKSFAGMSAELRNQGYTDSRRKYLVFLDHAPYCGFGTLYQDETAGIANASNGRVGKWGMALVGGACMNTVHAGAHTGLHELLHTLGAVANHAPNSTQRGHCTDGADIMCYADDSGTATRSVCPAASPFRVDCRNDDYFHPAVPTGHRLAGTWNVADSSFLQGSRFSDWVDPTAPELETETHDDGVLLTWSAVTGRYAKEVRVLRNDKVLATLPKSSREYDDTTAAAGTNYRYSVEVVDQLGYRAASEETKAGKPATSLLPTVTDVLSGGDEGSSTVPDAADDDRTRSGASSSRRAGPDRFATAAEVSRQTFSPGVARAYVAMGGNFPDALSAGAAAAAGDAPVLLTDTGSLPQATEDELVRLRPREVVVVGGTGAVSDTVVSRIRQVTGVATRRISGPDRFATAAAIAADAFPKTVSTVYVATGLSFPDALAGVPAAAGDGAPLLLVSADSVPAPTAQTLASLNPDEIVVLGGTGVIGDPVLAQLRKTTGAEVVRVAGPDRFSTAAAIAARSFPKGAGVGFLATGSGFADALAGGPAAAMGGGPVLLVQHDALPEASAKELTRLSPDQVVVLGGEAVVSRSTEAAAADAAR